MSMIFNFLRVSGAELDEYLQDSSLLEDRIFDDESDDGSLEDIDKSWEGLLFILTGQNLEGMENQEHSLSKVFFSGQVIDNEQDLGYGPGHYLTAEQVKHVNAEIAGISSADIKAKFDAKRMTELEVYPNIWDEEEAVNYLAEYFTTVQDVYATASKNNEAVITFLN
jgi:hypothetical protein